MRKALVSKTRKWCNVLILATEAKKDLKMPSGWSSSMVREQEASMVVVTGGLLWWFDRCFDQVAEGRRAGVVDTAGTHHADALAFLVMYLSMDRISL
jgi:hypothetical protein